VIYLNKSNKFFIFGRAQLREQFITDGSQTGTAHALSTV
jgi:hypothetical protein